MKQSSKDQIEGGARELKGKVKEAAGRAVNNKNLENKGTAEKLGGKVQKKVGQIEKVFNQ